MNLSEFKAWFEGFTENMDGEPNAKQWKRIKKRVSEIVSDPTPWPIFWERYRPWLPGVLYNGATTIGTFSSSSTKQVSANNALAALQSQGKWDGDLPQNSSIAFQDLGRAEWKQIL